MQHPTGSKGMTLLEILMVLAVIGILALYAVPTYQQHQLKLQRAKAQAKLLEHGLYMERYKLRNGSFAGAELPQEEDLPGYRIGFTSPPEAKRFSIQAVPQGNMAEDSCGTFLLDQDGPRYPEQEDCWYR